jgi:hypothetical protein
VGEKFGEYYFQTTINPFGTLYNPVSIANNLLPIASDHLPVVCHNGLWHSMMHHGGFSHPDKDELLQRCVESQTVMSRALQEASTIIVTFGTAWVYEYYGQVVANCHKLPAKDFVRRRLTVEEIVQTWQPIIEQMSDKQQNERNGKDIARNGKQKGLPHGKSEAKSKRNRTSGFNNGQQRAEKYAKLSAYGF